MSRKAGAIQYSVGFHEWDGHHYLPVESESAWSSFRRLPEKRRSEFSVTKEFGAWLSDAGARFTHHGRPTDLALDDLFVYPELRPLGDDDQVRVVVDSAKLRSPDSLERGVLIRGREQYGKTSLLKQLFRSYHDRGYVPVAMTGRELTKSTPRDIQKAVEAAVAKNYSKPTIPMFWQAGKDRRVLLLDDLDDTLLSGHSLSRAVEYL